MINASQDILYVSHTARVDQEIDGSTIQSRTIVKQPMHCICVASEGLHGSPQDTQFDRPRLWSSLLYRQESRNGQTESIMVLGH